jgi:hypothetical protein
MVNGHADEWNILPLVAGKEKIMRNIHCRPQRPSIIPDRRSEAGRLSCDKAQLELSVKLG